jgi:hypothetical protein
MDSGGNPPLPRQRHRHHARDTGAASAAASGAPAICTELLSFTVNHEDDSTSMSSRRSSRPSPDPSTSSSSKIKGTSRKLSQSTLVDPIHLRIQQGYVGESVGFHRIDNFRLGTTSECLAYAKYCQELFRAVDSLQDFVSLKWLCFRGATG